MCFILRIIFFHFLGKKKVWIKFFTFLKKSSDYIFFTFWKKKFGLYIIHYFGKKMAKRMKFSDDLSDYFQMTTQKGEIWG